MDEREITTISNLGSLKSEEDRSQPTSKGLLPQLNVPTLTASWSEHQQSLYDPSTTNPASFCDAGQVLPVNVFGTGPNRQPGISYSATSAWTALDEPGSRPLPSSHLSDCSLPAITIDTDRFSDPSAESSTGHKPASFGEEPEPRSSVWEEPWPRSSVESSDLLPVWNAWKVQSSPQLTRDSPDNQESLHDPTRWG